VLSPFENHCVSHSLALYVENFGFEKFGGHKSSPNMRALTHTRRYMCSFDLCSGRTKSGDPISIECTPKFDFEKIFAIDGKTHDDYLIHALEYHIFVLDQLYLKTGKLAGYVKIFDLEEFRLKQVNVLNQWRKNTAKQVERLGVNILECYPELYAKILIVNAPSFFAVAWKVIKPFVPARTTEKVNVESNSKKAKEILLEIMEPHVLPAFLGGEYTGEWRMLPGGEGEDA